jgi:hypothetical protein
VIVPALWLIGRSKADTIRLVFLRLCGTKAKGEPIVNLAVFACYNPLVGREFGSFCFIEGGFSQGRSFRKFILRNIYCSLP